MPKRSNPFQELVTLIQEALAPQGAKVTASAMVPGPTSGRLREIDVLVEHLGGPQALKVAVEAKDERRKLDVLTVEGLIGKYFGPGALPVGEVVLVAHRGFTEEATVRAKDVGIRLFTLAEAKAADWNRFFPPGLVPHGFVIENGLVAVDLDPIPALPGHIDKTRFFSEGRSICSCCGRELSGLRAPLQRIAVAVKYQLAPWTRVFQAARHAAVRNGGEFEFPVELRPERKEVIRFEGADYSIESVRITMRCVYLVDSLLVSSHTLTGESDETNVVHSVSVNGPIGIQMLMPMGKKDSRGIIKHRADFSRLLGPPWLQSLSVESPRQHYGQAPPHVPTQEFVVQPPGALFSEHSQPVVVDDDVYASLGGTFNA